MKRKVSTTDFDTVDLLRPAKRRRLDDDNQTDGPGAAAPCHQNQAADSHLILAKNVVSSTQHDSREKEILHVAQMEDKQTPNANLQSETDRVENTNVPVDDQKEQPSQINRFLLWLLNIYPSKQRVVLKPPPIPQQNELNKPSLSNNGEGATKVCEDFPGSSSGLTILAQTALSADYLSSNSYPTKSAETDTKTITEGVRSQPSKLDRLLSYLMPSGYPSETGPGSSTKSVCHREADKPSGSSQSNTSESTKKRRKGVPHKRPSSSSQTASTEGVPNKKVKLSDKSSSIKKAKEKVKIKPPQSLIGQYRRKSEVPRNEKNREIDSKDAHKMKYPSHLHEWLERVKFNHTRKWQTLKYSEPKWTAWQLAQTNGSPKRA
ncbi:uncharacterized protein LOC134242975 isoform X2 [Saccostrea cucullata]|uniref:uncharacterized protein LOC134242975 isoform X2 n=1 Tax=Saccostrea cuccullata TaxID=36930 RepID=UPI002ED25CEF